MARTFYSEFVTHCLRFYVRHPEPEFHSEADKKNWIACDSVIRKFTDSDQEIIFEIYKYGDSIPDNVQSVALRFDIGVAKVWTIVNKLERKVAKSRGLL